MAGPGEAQHAVRGIEHRNEERGEGVGFEQTHVCVHPGQDRRRRGVQRGEGPDGGPQRAHRCRRRDPMTGDVAHHHAHEGPWKRKNVIPVACDPQGSLAERHREAKVSPQALARTIGEVGMLKCLGRPVLGVVGLGPLGGVAGQAGDLADDAADRIGEEAGLVETERHRPTAGAGGPERKRDDCSFTRQRPDLSDPRIDVADILGRGELQRDPAPDGVRPEALQAEVEPVPPPGRHRPAAKRRYGYRSGVIEQDRMGPAGSRRRRAVCHHRGGHVRRRNGPDQAP